jgi:hypothetical protein
MSKPKKEYQKIDIRFSLYQAIKKLAFPEPSLEKRVVASVIMEVGLRHVDEVEAELSKLRSEKQ